MRVIALSICWMFIITSILFAQNTIELPHQFQNGTPANADEVNENFNKLAEELGKFNDGRYPILQIFTDAPPAVDCDEESEKGRLSVATNGMLHVCLEGWVSISPCGEGKHVEGAACVPDTRSCTVSHGSGTQEWNGTSWNACSNLTCNSGYYLSSNQCKLSSPVGTIAGNWYSIPSSVNGCNDVSFMCNNGNCSIRLASVGTNQFGHWDYGTVAITAGQAHHQNSERTVAWNGVSYWGRCSVFWDSSDGRMKYKMWTNSGGSCYHVQNTNSCGSDVWYNVN